MSGAKLPGPYLFVSALKTVKPPSMKQWLADNWPGNDGSHLRVLADGVREAAIENLKNPDIEAPAPSDAYVALSDCNTSDGTLNGISHSSFLCFLRSGLIREDRIFDAFKGQETDVKEVLDRLGQCWLVRGVFEPSERLSDAFLHAYKWT